MKKSLKSRFKVKKMFSSLLLSYGTLLAVPFLVVFILLAFLGNSTEKYYKETVKSSLAEGRNQFEKRLEIMATGAFSVLNDSELNWVYYLDGLNPGDTRISTLVRCNEMLKQTFADSDKYYNYSVVLKNGFSFRKQGMTTGKEFFYNNYRRYEAMSYEVWLEQSFGAGEWQLFPMQKIKTEDTVEEALTFSYPIRSGFTRKGDAEAVVQFLLTRVDVEKMFSNLTQMQGMVSIFSADGTGLAEIFTKGMEEDSVTAGELDWEELPEIGSCEIIKKDGRERMVACQQSEDGKLIFAVSLPSEIGMMNFAQTRGIAFVLLLISFLFEITLGCRFAYKYSMPIRNLVENMQRMFAMEADGQGVSQEAASEYDYLEKGVNALLDNHRVMKGILQENFLTLLLGGEFHSEQEILEESEHAGVDLTAATNYCVVLLVKKEREKVLRMLEEIKGEVIVGWHILTEERIAVLAACESIPEGEQMLEGSALLQREIRERNLTGIYMGIGSAYTEKQEIPYSFSQACYCADKAEREQKEGCVEYSKELLKLNMPWYPAEAEEKLVNSVRGGNSDTVNTVFERIREENLEKVHLSRVIEKMVVSNITATLIGLYNSLAENDNITELIEEIEKAETLEAALPVLKNRFVELSERMDVLRSRKNETYYLRLKEYIENNYTDAQLGVGMAAAAFGLSESYFSLFFKETMGKTFGSYLEGVRLEKAKRLIAQGNFDLEKISEMVGYSSSATFRRAFKRAYGVAPSAWKE